MLCFQNSVYFIGYGSLVAVIRLRLSSLRSRVAVIRLRLSSLRSLVAVMRLRLSSLRSLVAGAGIEPAIFRL